MMSSLSSQSLALGLEIGLDHVQDPDRKDLGLMNLEGLGGHGLDHEVVVETGIEEEVVLWKVQEIIIAKGGIQAAVVAAVQRGLEQDLWPVWSRNI